MYLLNIYMIVRCVLWLVVIVSTYYMSDQIIQLENRVDALEAQSSAIQHDIVILHEAMHLLIKFIREKLNLFV